MKLKIKAPKVPQAPHFNFDELKAEICAKKEKYAKAALSTEEQVKTAKKDFAEMEKLRKRLNEERIRIKTEYMVPFNAFEAQAMELIGIASEPILTIEQQLSDYYEQKKKAKQETIERLWEQTRHPRWLHLKQITSARWLSDAVDEKQIGFEIGERLKQIEQDMETINRIPAFAFEAAQEYRKTLNLEKAIAKGQRLAYIRKAREEWERRKNRTLK